MADPPSLTLPTVDLSEASAILQESVYTVAPIGQGLRSRVFRAETDDGTVRVIRLTPRGAGRVAREAWVRARIGRHADLPMLAQVQVHHVPLALQADVVTMAELPGTTMFAAIRTLFEPEVCTLYERFGAGLAALHAVTVEGYGLIDGTGHGPFDTYHAAFEATLRAAFEEARIAGLGDLQTRVEDVVSRASEPVIASVSRAALLHGDAQPMNVQVHRGRIVAWLDFEFAAGGDPRAELAYVAPLFEPSPGGTVGVEALAARRAAFYRGYGASEPDAHTMALYRLIHALRGTEFLSVVGPKMTAPVREASTRAVRENLLRWISALE